MTEGTDDPGTPEPDGSGRRRAENAGQRRRPADGAVMAPSPAQVFVLVLILAVALAAPLAAAPAHQGTADGEAVGNATDPGAGAHLAGIVAVQNSTVEAAVANGTFQARLANASTDSARAALVDRRLDAIDRRLAAAQERSRALSRTRAEESLSGDVYTARAAGVADTADRLVDAATATERAADSLPPDRRASLRVAERAEAIRTDARRLRERMNDAADAIDGVGEESRAAPVSRGAVEDILDSVAGAETPLSGVARSERMNVHIRQANGTTPVFAVRIENGRVRSVADGRLENPTLSVYTDYRVVDRVRRAQDPAAAIRTAIENDRVRYDGHGFGSSLKYGTLKLVSLLSG